MAAGYDVNLNIALKNSNKLMQLRKELKAAGDAQVRFNKAASEGNGIAVATFNKLNKQLSRAKGLLDKAAYGTDSFKRAARALVNVEKEHNHQLKEKEKLLNKLRMESDPLFQLKQQRKQQIKENIRQNRALRFTNVNPGRPAVVGDYGQAGGRVGPAQILNNSQGGFLAFSKVADKIADGVKANVKQTTKTAQVITQQATKSNFDAISNQFGVPGGRIGPQNAPFFNRMGFGANAKSTGPFAMPGGAAGRLKGGVGSALIGGGFPFLFGAGGLSAIMGGAAGAIGGALAPGGGFALSIAATAAAAQIEDAINFRKELKLVNNQLLAVGSSANFSRGEVKELAKQFNITKEEATQLIDSFVPRFENELDVNALLDVFGKDGLKLFDAVSGATDNQKLINEIVNARDIIGQTKADELLADLKTETSLEVQLRLTREIAKANRKRLLEDLELNEKIGGERYEKVVNRNFEQFISQLDPDSDLAKLLQENLRKDLSDIKTYQELARNYGSGGGTFKFSKEVEEIFRRDFFNFLNPLDEAVDRSQKLVEFAREYTLQLQEFEEFKAPVDEIERLSRATRVVLDLSKEIKTSFAESFKGIVKGTMTVTDAFRNMLNRIGDYFLDLAAQVLAAGIQKSFLGLFQNMFNIQMPSPMAEGGRVTGGKPYIVGERGPELFSPGVSGNITPNHALGGSTNIVVNVDASGSSVEGDEQQGRELGRMISVAIQSELIKQKRPGGLLT